MPTLPLYNLEKKKVGTIDLEDSIFAEKVKPHLLHDAVRIQIARRYEWRTANSLTRTEVTATGKKIYKQKGTGQARHGDIKAPVFVGGGKAHGPKPRRVIRSMNKQMMKSALICALSAAQKEDRLFVIDKMELPKHSTKKVATCLKSFGVETGLFVNPGNAQPSDTFNRSTRNLPRVKHLKPEGINVFDILKYKNILISQQAIAKITERFHSVKE